MARAGDWMASQADHLMQLRAKQEEHKVPIVYAGDIFHKWNPSPKLINFAMQYLPKGYGIPGQHDLPFHSYDDIEKSAYWTLVIEGTICDLAPHESPVAYDVLRERSAGCRVRLHPFPWGFDVIPWGGEEDYPDITINLAVIHSYIWCAGQAYSGAPEDKKVMAWRSKLKGYDCALFGDNHKSFLIQGQRGVRPTIYNHGNFLRRSVDERDTFPEIGVLYSDGSVIPERLDLERDEWSDHVPTTSGEEDADIVGVDEFVKELKTLGVAAVDFKRAVKRFAQSSSVREAVRKVVLEILEGS